VTGYKCIQNIWLENYIGRDHLSDQDKNGEMIILKWVLEKHPIRDWTRSK